MGRGQRARRRPLGQPGVRSQLVDAPSQHRRRQPAIAKTQQLELVEQIVRPRQQRLPAQIARVGRRGRAYGRPLTVNVESTNMTIQVLRYDRSKLR